MYLFKLQNVFVQIKKCISKFTSENLKENEVVGWAGELEKFEGSMKVIKMRKGWLSAWQFPLYKYEFYQYEIWNIIYKEKIY